MCGILGIISDNSEKYIEKANNRISHRGPDDTGYFIDGNVSLAHQRLSILDLSTKGHQPMISECKDYVIIFNGEIYNHNEIRSNLNEKYKFNSSTDTETILYGFIEFGTSIFKKLNGIFALAIYQISNKKLIIVNDQFGIKPLYYQIEENSFIFGSELKSFLELPDLKKELDITALFNYIKYLWSPGEKTPFKHVKKLLPGHYIEYNVVTKTATFTKYYELPFNGQYSKKTEKELIDELNVKLLKAVKRQLMSDVPIGFFLSGGVDSTLIVALAKEIMPNEKLTCYTIDNGGGESFEDDLYYTKKVAKLLDVNLKIVKANVDIVNNFDKMIYHLDEPQSDAAPLNVMKICNAAKKDGIPVLLGGSAGDDVFSGYRRHQALAFEKYFKLMPLFFKKGVKSISNKMGTSSVLSRRIKKVFKDIDKDPLERMVGYFSWLSDDLILDLFTTENKNILKDYNPKELYIKSLNNIPKEKSFLNQMLYWEMKYFLKDHNLNYTDKLSMSEGVEVRVPFLDLDLIEFSTKIPIELKMKGKTTKYLLKKVLEKYIPREIIYRSKVGFGAPIRDWILNDLEAMINEYLSKESISKRGLFDYEKVNHLIKKNEKGIVDASYSIWSLLAIESWCRQFID